jgi:hypothetical protein
MMVFSKLRNGMEHWIIPHAHSNAGAGCGEKRNIRLQTVDLYQRQQYTDIAFKSFSDTAHLLPFYDYLLQTQTEHI